MRTNRFWVIDIITVVAGIACALALLIATLGAVAGAATGETELAQSAEPPATTTSPQQTFDGMITDTRCGAKHVANLGKTASDCTRACVHAGEKFALVDGDKTYILNGDAALLKKLAGQRARITGELSGNTINVSAIAAAS